MAAIGIRELRQKASYYLSRVAGGEPIEITDRGRPVARLVPVANDPWQHLIDAGEVTPAASNATPRDFEPLESDVGGSAMLDALRGSER